MASKARTIAEGVDIVDPEQPTLHLLCTHPVQPVPTSLVRPHTLNGGMIYPNPTVQRKEPSESNRESSPA